MSEEPGRDQRCGTCKWFLQHSPNHGTCHCPLGPLPACVVPRREIVHKDSKGNRLGLCPCWQQKETSDDDSGRSDGRV